MPKHYEALQRAEQERREKVSGVDAPLPASVPFEGPAATVQRRQKPPGLLSRLLVAARILR